MQVSSPDFERKTCQSLCLNVKGKKKSPQDNNHALTCFSLTSCPVSTEIILSTSSILTRSLLIFTSEVLWKWKWPFWPLWPLHDLWGQTVPCFSVPNCVGLLIFTSEVLCKVEPGHCSFFSDGSRFIHNNWISYLNSTGRPLTAKLRWCLFSSVSHVSDRLELHNNNWASGSKHPGPYESDVYSDLIQEAQSNDLLHTARLLIDAPRYTSPWQQCKRHQVRGVLRECSNTYRVRK